MRIVSSQRPDVHALGGVTPAFDERRIVGLGVVASGDRKRRLKRDFFSR